MKLVAYLLALTLASACCAQDVAARLDALERRVSAVELTLRPATQPAVNFDIEYSGAFSCRVRAKVDGDPKLWNFMWDFGGAKCKGHFSGFGFIDSTPKTVTMTATTPGGLVLPPVVKTYTPPPTPRAAVKLKPSDRFPDSIGGNTDIDLGGGTFDLGGRVPVVTGGNVAIRNGTLTGIGARAFKLDTGKDVLFADLVVVGTGLKGSLFSTLRIDGVTFVNVTVRNLDNFILQSAASPDYATFIGCRTEGLQGYAYNISGKGWVIAGATNGDVGKGTQSVLRSSSTGTEDLLVFGCELTVKGTGNGVIDIRIVRGFAAIDNKIHVSSLRVGCDDATQNISSDVLLRGNSVDNTIRLVSGLSDVVCDGNTGAVELSAPDKFDGRPGIKNVTVKAANAIWRGDATDPRAFENVKVTQ